MPSPTASVALCAYNGAAYLEEQLDSIARQSLPPAELVVRDDGSTDTTIAVVERFAARAPFPVRLIRNSERLGYRANFMAAAAACTGDLIFFSDQDDIWREHKIARMSRAFEQDPKLLLAYHDATVVDAGGRGDAPLLDAVKQRSVLAQAPMPPWHYTLGFTQTFRRDLLEYQALWPGSRDHMQDAVMAHDQWFIFLAAALGRVAFVEERLAFHRQHGANTYGVQVASRWRRLLSRFEHLPDWDGLAANAAESRADVLQAMVADAADPGRLRTIAELYRGLAKRHARRHAAYSAATARRRAAYFARALLGRDYGARPWRLEPKAIPRDAMLGVLRGGAGRPA